MTVAAIVVASDPATGGDMPAALLPADGDTVLIEYVIQQVRSAGVRDVVVVLGPAPGDVLPYVRGDNVEPIVNNDWRGGFAASLRVGSAAVPRGTTAALIMRVDEPRDAGVIATLLQAHGSSAAPLTRPTFDGTAGAPMVINESMLAELRAVADQTAFEALIARHADQATDVPFDTELVLARVSTAEDYRRLRGMLDG